MGEIGGDEVILQELGGLNRRRETGINNVIKKANNDIEEESIRDHYKT